MTIQYDANGIITQNILEITSERESALQQIMGEDFVIDKTTPIGNMELADINSELSIQELIAWLIPNQLDANTATGIFLDAICEKNRIYRRQPAYTVLKKVIINGTPGTKFYSGDITVEDSISKILYDLNKDCVVGEDGKVEAEFICEEFGENYPLSSSKLNIQTPMGGLNSIDLNYENLDIIYGRLVETDNELRRRRMLSVGQTSSNTLNSIMSVIYSLDGVKYVTCFENDSNTEKNGIPMKSFEYVVHGGDENEIADAIFNNKPIGTYAYGTTIIQKKDSCNNVYDIGFTKAEKVNVGLKVNILISSLQAESWTNELKNKILEKFNKIQSIGEDVKSYNFYEVLTSYSVITGIDYILIYNINNPDATYSNFNIGNKQIAILDINNIEINVRTY